MTKQLLFACLTVALASSAAAEAPPMVPVQGHLASADGTPIDGPTKLRFRLYDRPSPTGSGSEVLFEEQQEIQVHDGFFAAYLGDKTDLPLDLFREKSVVFVGIRVNDDTAELQPLLQLATTPYAAYANACGEATRLGGKSAEDIIAAAAPKPGSMSPGGGTVGPRGPAGPAGPVGPPGVLEVRSDGRVRGEIKNQVLTLESAAPASLSTSAFEIALGPARTDVVWTDAYTPSEDKVLCVITAAGWLVNAQPTTWAWLHTTAEVDGVRQDRYLGNEEVPVFSTGSATTVVPFRTSKGKAHRFACTINNPNGAPAASCKINVVCS